MTDTQLADLSERLRKSLDHTEQCLRNAKPGKPYYHHLKGRLEGLTLARSLCMQARRKRVNR